MGTELEFHDNDSDRTIVSFTGIGHGMGAIQMNEFFRLTQAGFNVLFVRDTERSWYNAVDTDSVKKVLGDQPVITIGNSMGAFHAAMFAMDHPVTAAIAFAVQYSIHPEVVPFDRRYRKYAAAVKEWKYRRLMLNDSTQYHFISGDEKTELRHLKMIPRQPNVHTTVIQSGHKVAARLKQEGRLYALIRDIIGRSDDDMRQAS